MSRKEDPALRKLELEKSQIRSILSDFRKTKYKCMNLCKEIGKEMPNSVQFDSIEKEINMKIDLLDVIGLVKLKNKLVKSKLCFILGLSELFDVESELSTSKGRIAARKEFSEFVVHEPPKKKESKNLSLEEIQNRANRLQQKLMKDNDDKILPLPKTTKNQLYQLSEDEMESKEEKQHSEAFEENPILLENKKVILEEKPQEEKNNQKKFTLDLQEYVEFLKMKKQLEVYKKKSEDLEAKLKKIEEGSNENDLKNAEIVEETENYKLVKIWSKPNEKKVKSEAVAQSSTPSPLPISSEASAPKRMVIPSLDQEIENLKSKRKDAEIIEIERSLEEEHCNFESIVSKINITLESNEEKLRMLRQQRMRMFEKEQEIWDELEQF